MPVLILLHGLCSHSLRQEYLADYFHKLKYNVYAFDFTGFGKSQAFQGHVESFNTYINETLAMLKLTNIEFPENKKFLIGDDMGGIVSLFFARYYQKLVDGLILLSPLTKFKLHISFQKILNTMMNMMINKFHQFDLPFTNEMLTQDFQIQKELQHDEMDGKTVTSKFYFTLVDAMKKVNKTAQLIDIPVYTIQSGNDVIVDVESVREMFSNLGSSVKELHVLPGFYHALALEKDRKIVFKLIERWINKMIFMGDLTKGKRK